MDIPIYRCTPKQFEIETEGLLAKHLKFVKIPELRLQDEAWFKRNAPGWDFNEIVGWIRLTATKQNILGELFWTRAQRLRRGIWKGFKYREKAFKLYFPPGERSEAIFQRLTARLEKLKEEPPFRNRHIDLRALNFIGPHVNWRTLISPTKREMALGLSRGQGRMPHPSAKRSASSMEKNRGVRKQKEEP